MSTSKRMFGTIKNTLRSNASSAKSMVFRPFSANQANPTANLAQQEDILQNFIRKLEHISSIMIQTATIIERQMPLEINNENNNTRQLFHKQNNNLFKNLWKNEAELIKEIDKFNDWARSIGLLDSNNNIVSTHPLSEKAESLVNIIDIINAFMENFKYNIDEIISSPYVDPIRTNSGPIPPETYS